MSASSKTLALALFKVRLRLARSRLAQCRLGAAHLRLGEPSGESIARLVQIIGLTDLHCTMDSAARAALLGAALLPRLSAETIQEHLLELGKQSYRSRRGREAGAQGEENLNNHRCSFLSAFSPTLSAFVSTSKSKSTTKLPGEAAGPATFDTPPPPRS